MPVFLARWLAGGACLAGALALAWRAAAWEPALNPSQATAAAIAVGQDAPVALAAPDAWHGQAYRRPLAYDCYFADRSPAIDGRLDDAAWAAAPWSTEFGDIAGALRPKPRYATRVKMLWTHEALCLGAELTDPDVWATIQEHDAVIFHDNDFEVFLDPDGDNHRYGELELNALNTTWDLFLPRPYKDGGSVSNSWEIQGLRTAVAIDGTLNQAGDVDRGWTVEIWIPFAGLERLGVSRAPLPDATWRVNFSRVQWRSEFVQGARRRLPGQPEDNWVWSPQWVVNMHRPETWGYVAFREQAPRGPRQAPEHPDPDGPLRHWLHQAYYAQRAHRGEQGQWAVDLAQLRLAPPGSGIAERQGIETTSDGYRVWATRGKLRWTLDQDARLWSEALAP